MDEVTMRAQAKAGGLEVMNFIADYKIGGVDHHRVYQTVVQDGIRLRAGQAIYHLLIEQGAIPQLIAYVPGNYTMDELDAMSTDFTADPAIQPIYISGETLALMYLSCGVLE